jgi:hypothetical protein
MSSGLEVTLSERETLLIGELLKGKKDELV